MEKNVIFLVFWKKIGPVTVRRPRLYGQSPPIQNLGTCLHKTARARVHVHVGHVACPPLFLEFSPTPNFGTKFGHVPS